MPSSLALRKLFLYLCLLTLTQCSTCKNDPVPQDPAAQLPPATQTGAGTFGCLVNGQVYTPSENTGTSNFNATYDPTFQGGTLDLRAYNCSGDCASTKRTIILGGVGINKAGTYSLVSMGQQSASFFDRGRAFPCSEYDGSRGAYVNGVLIISRLSGGIISGTFNFKTAQPGCDTLRITQGRFDAKF
ncbi:hypothetical protein [Hymenobacter ruricola]|uniref:Lipoprotein n=1 Tax=Hymenobacter ruricola TaxID=2791023 RepID=A0ABS0I8L8_9BACT|nr:hypothetical protein [Hymenobacter ruricola]MBF9223295.1 hypothetical protein [Hymenobacter ruricola]